MLKSLEVYGFKSFADRTVFAFAPGTTCVVGPNGSGKSNVVDAMKWLLGDQSPKSLRGKNMADVIFNGSRSRKPSGFAEATLTFDNSQRILQVDLEEVRITRRLYQGGDSEYLINNETSRLKDIRDLFMGTGAATSAYSIIEQGRVGQVLQGNPSTRRVLFDEAAGISRFKVRRLDAEKKLERVSQNLLRLTDIVDEVETQRNAARNQAGKAARYRELARAYDALWLGLAADDTRRIFTRLDAQQQTSTQLASEVAAARQEYQTLELEREQLRHAFSVADEELQQLEGKLSSLMQQRSSLLTSLHHQQDRTREISTEADALRKQRVELKRRDQEIQREIQAVEEQSAQARAAVATKQQERNADEQQLEERNQQIDRLREQREQGNVAWQQKSRAQAAAENHLLHLQTRQQTLAQAIERITGEIETAQAEIDQRLATVEQAQNRHDAALQKNEEHRREIEEIATRRTSLKQEVTTIHARLRADREQRSAWEARLGLLEDMEKRQLGLSVGVQEILRRARTSRAKPWKHVLGILPDFLECDLEQAPLVEIALGGGSHLIVVDQLGPILEYLDQGETLFEGRVGFLEVPTGKPSREQITASEQAFALEMVTTAEVVARADQFVRCAEQFRPLIEQLLARTWIVDRLTTARRLALNAPGGTRFLTLQGDLLERDGLVQTGTLMPEGSVVSRRSEIRRIKTELQQLDRHIQRLTEKVAEFDQILLKLDHELKNAQDWMESQSAELAELKQEVVSRQADHRQAARERQRLEQDQQTLREQLAGVADEIAQERETLARFQEELTQIREQNQQRDQQLRDAQQHRQELLQGRSQFQLELAKLEERQHAADAVLARLKKDRQLRQAQHEEAVSRLEQSLTKRSRLELQTLNAQSKLAELYLIGEQLQVEVHAARTRRGQTQSQRDQLNERLKQLADFRRAREEQLQDLRIEIRDLDNELQSLSEKIGEEYQYSLRDLLDANLSACAAYQKLRQGEEIDAIEYPPRSMSVKESLPDDAEALTGTSVAVQSTSVDEQPADTSLAPVTSGSSPSLYETLADWAGQAQHASAWDESDFAFEDARDEIDREIGRLRKKIKALGAVDPDSLKGLDELEARYQHLHTQLLDLKHAQATLEDIIRKINTESRRIFVESFNTIREHFRELFRQLFGGGEGDVMMEDESDPLECGIEIVARPPGKELRSISLLSGGEKTMTAVGLLLAIFRSRPSPFCILDEVDAALDEANIDRFANVIGQFQDKTQFIVITHRKRTMTAADRIFGVTMEEAGVSKRLTVRFEDVGENGEIKTSGNAAA